MNFPFGTNGKFIIFRCPNRYHGYSAVTSRLPLKQNYKEIEGKGAFTYNSWPFCGFQIFDKGAIVFMGAF